MDEGRPYRRIEVITGRRQRRSYRAEEKARIVAESAVPGANISEVARRNGVNRGLLTVWRREAGVVPVSVPGEYSPEGGG
ncbi:transposase [Azospirillum thiophilum]